MSRRFYSTGAAEEIIKSIKRGEYTNELQIRGLLLQIINDCPRTKVAKDAKELMEDLGLQD